MNVMNICSCCPRPPHSNLNMVKLVNSRESGGISDPEPVLLCLILRCSIKTFQYHPDFGAHRACLQVQSVADSGCLRGRGKKK